LWQEGLCQRESAFIQTTITIEKKASFAFRLRYAQSCAAAHVPVKNIPAVVFEPAAKGGSSDSLR
jgi:hypothetical protein